MEPSLIFMARALELAMQAGAENEVPVGAVIVFQNQIIAEAYNKKEQEKSATRHAELIAIEKASQALGRWRLLDCELYVTLEPCLMCAGAVIQSRLKAVYFSTRDPKGGAMGSVLSIQNLPPLNHRFPTFEGLLAEESQKLLKDFFQKKRTT